MNNKLWLIWKQPVSRRRYKIGELCCIKNGYSFNYTNPELDEAIKAGFNFFPGFEDTKKEYLSSELFANIDTRLPNTSRPDYLEILNSYGLERTSTKFDILKATRGRLLTDNYEFVPIFDKTKLEFDIAGTRHCKDIKKCLTLIKTNDKLELELEPGNEYDENAIKVIINKNGKKYHIGYVPRYYTKQLAELLNEKIEYSAMISSLNFESKLNDEDITANVKLIFK